MERDASMTKDYYCYSSSTLLRYTEDCSSVVGTAAAHDGESSQRNEHELSDRRGGGHDRLGETKAVGKKQRGTGLQVRGFIGSRERQAYQLFV